MQTHSTVDDILKDVDRFRILCVGRAGVGKSSVINRVFGLKEASVEHWNVGQANIERGLTSEENRFFVLHDSMGFEAGGTETFDIVSKFVNRRRDKSLPLKDRLHAIWLCTETPTAGGRVFETGDEKLLQLAYQTETPVVVVFTKYDRLLRSKKIELRGDQDGPDPEDLEQRTEGEASRVLQGCVQSLERAMVRLKTPMARHVNVSNQPGYETLMLSLVEVTREVVQEKLKGDAWVMWAIAQRASLPLKIDACAANGIVYYKRSLDGDMPVVGRVLLRDCLAELHQDIITCWNFRDEKQILTSDGFKQLMQYLVQDVQESQNRGDSQYTRSPTIDKIFHFLDLITDPSSAHPSPQFSTSGFADWLKGAVLHNAPQVRLVLMTYIVDLTAVLKSLFMITLNQAPQSSGVTTWPELKRAFHEYDAGSRQRIHHRICANFQQDQQILPDPESFRRIFYDLVNDSEAPASVSTPVSTSNPGFPKSRPPTVRGGSQASSGPAGPPKSRSPPVRGGSQASSGPIAPKSVPAPSRATSGATSSLAPGGASGPTSGQSHKRRIRDVCLCQ